MDKRPKVGVGVFVFHNGLFVMGWRENDHGANSWAIPGGHLEFGEHFAEAASREVKEETGIEIANIQFGAITNNIFAEERKHSVTIWMLSDYVEGELTVKEPDKLVDLSWFGFDSLPEPLFPPWQQLFQSPFFDDIKHQAEKTKIS